MEVAASPTSSSFGVMGVVVTRPVDRAEGMFMAKSQKEGPRRKSRSLLCHRPQGIGSC